MLRLLRLVVAVNDNEVKPVLYAFASFFCLLASYFVVVPLREEAGMSLGTDILPKLFTCSLLGALVITPLSSILLSRPDVPRERLLRHLFVILAACMLGFYVLYHTSFTHSRIAHASHGSSYPHVAAEAAPNTRSKTQQQRQLHAQGSPGDTIGPSSSSSMANVHRHWASPDRPPRDPLHIMPEDLSEGHQEGLGSNLDVNHHATRRLLKQDASSSSSSEAGSGGPHAEHGPSMSHHDLIVKKGDPDLDTFQRMVRAAFYVWINVQNLVAMSAMWARCADVFPSEAANRLFGFISAGATLGQLAGSLTTVAFTKGSPGQGSDPSAHKPALAPLILASSLLLLASAILGARVTLPSKGGTTSQGANRSKDSHHNPRQPAHDLTRTRSARKTAGRAAGAVSKVVEGWVLILRSRYLLVLCSYLLCTYIVGSLMYFQRYMLVATMVSGANSRAAFFGQVYSLSAALIFVLQMFVTGRLLHAVGITASLAILPFFCLVTTSLLTTFPSPSMMAATEVGRKLLGYSLVRPAREVLFTVVTRDEKYKAKLAIDAVIQRLGDTLAAGVFEILDVRMRLGVSGVSWAASAACVVWAWTAFALGSKYKALGSAATTAGQTPAERSSQSVTLPAVAGGSGGGGGTSMDGGSGGSSSIFITHAGELRWQGRDSQSALQEGGQSPTKQYISGGGGTTTLIPVVAASGTQSGLRRSQRLSSD